MVLKDKYILLISPEPWDHIFVSKHHYATHLAKRGNRVFFLNPPSNQTIVEKTEFENVNSIHYNGFIKGLRFFPSFAQRYFIRKKFQQLQLLCKVKFDIIWSFDNSVFFDFSALPDEVLCISHIVDLSQDFEFRKATKTADLCLATTDFIFKKQKIYKPSSFNLGHGFNLLTNNDRAFHIKGNAKINVGYAGNLDIKYIDWGLIEKLLLEFPNIDFHFAGQWNSKPKYKHITQKSNFHFYGKLPSDDLLYFYGSLDILLLAYQYQNYPEQLANPHKVMEYLGSGRMIMASWTEEYVQLVEDRLIKMAKNSEVYMNFFKEIISDLTYWNNVEKIRCRKEIANNNSYDNQIDKVEDLLNG